MIRGLFAAFAGFLLFSSLLAFGISWDLSSSLKYENVEANAVEAMLNVLNSQMNITQQIDQNLPMIQQYCRTNPQGLVLNYQGYNITISCQDANGNSTELVKNTLKNFVNEIYYTNYDCNYWGCFKKYSGSPLFLLSEKSYSYWKNIFYYSAAATIALFIAFSLLYKKKENLMITSGIIIMLSSLPLLVMQKILSTFPKIVSDVGSVFFSQSGIVFLTMVISGAVITGVGIILRVFGIGVKIYEIFEKRKKAPIQAKEEKSAQGKQGK